MRLLDVTCDATPPVKWSGGGGGGGGAGMGQFSRDEQLYHSVCEGIVSLRRVEITSTTTSSSSSSSSKTGDVAPSPPFRIIACSATEPSPMLVNIVSSLTVQTLSAPTSHDVGIDQ